MKRGDLYRVFRGSRYDPKDHRVFLVVSAPFAKQMALEFCSAKLHEFAGWSFAEGETPRRKRSFRPCAPVYSKYGAVDTQVEIGVEEGMKHDSAVYCDELISLPKSLLTDYIGSLSAAKMEAVNAALRIALAV